MKLTELNWQQFTSKAKMPDITRELAKASLLISYNGDVVHLELGNARQHHPLLNHTDGLRIVLKKYLKNPYLLIRYTLFFEGNHRTEDTETLQDLIRLTQGCIENPEQHRQSLEITQAANLKALEFFQRHGGHG